MRHTRPPTIGDATRLIAANVDVPVRLPADLPHGTSLNNRPVHVSRKTGSAQLDLLLANHKTLTIQYGNAGFDGCGPVHPRAVHVGPYHAVLDDYRLPSGSPYATVVWPATLKSMQGDYAISGSVSAKIALRFARSMAKDRTTPGRPQQRPGC